MDNPKSFNFGGGDLVEISYLEKVFGIPRATAFLYLKALHIEPLHIGKEAFFNIVTFKRLMFVLSLPGSPGFAFPGSVKKAVQTKNHTHLVEVTPDIIQRASDPAILAEMAAAGGGDPGTLRRFAPTKAGRLKEKKEEKE